MSRIPLLGQRMSTRTVTPLLAGSSMWPRLAASATQRLGALLCRQQSTTSLEQPLEALNTPTVGQLRRLPSVPLLGSLPYITVKRSEIPRQVYKMWHDLGQLHGPFFQ
eukprot:scaffold81899_cov37-Tisochrysis_lutea.AAC.6